MSEKRTDEILKILRNSYPDAGCELKYMTPFELVVSVLLSAQCTDKCVNKVTQELFKIANTPQAFNDMPVEMLEKQIFSCGFYHNKAKAIKSLSKDIVEKHGGVVPDTMEGLTSLSGVGNKTASVVMSVGFGKQALPVDTHVFRVSHRLGLSTGNTADKVMEDLKAQFAPADWYDLHHTMIFHGRYTCHSQHPDCENCKLTKFCKFKKETNV